MSKKKTDDQRAPIVTEWAGLPKFACPLCPFDTLDEQRITEHLNPLHGNHPIVRTIAEVLKSAPEPTGQIPPTAPVLVPTTEE